MQGPVIDINTLVEILKELRIVQGRNWNWWNGKKCAHRAVFVYIENHSLCYYCLQKVWQLFACQKYLFHIFIWLKPCFHWALRSGPVRLGSFRMVGPIQVSIPTARRTTTGHEGFNRCLVWRHSSATTTNVMLQITMELNFVLLGFGLFVPMI